MAFEIMRESNDTRGRCKPNDRSVGLKCKGETVYNSKGKGYVCSQTIHKQARLKFSACIFIHLHYHTNCFKEKLLKGQEPYNIAFSCHFQIFLWLPSSLACNEFISTTRSIRDSTESNFPGMDVKYERHAPGIVNFYITALIILSASVSVVQP